MSQSISLQKCIQDEDIFSLPQCKEVSKSVEIARQLPVHCAGQTQAIGLSDVNNLFNLFPIEN
jgi:hypothetical protein